MTKCRFSCEFFGDTNQGMVRANNEDTYICQQIWDDTHILCAAIDGLGGYEGGEIAAELARTTIIKHLEDFASKKIGELLKAALIDANNEIISQHKARPNVSQMGCVASVGIVDLTNGVISIAHVGDSRIYQFVNGELKKLTHDHSLVGYREEIGELSEEDAMIHPKRNVIDKFLGEQHLNYDTESYVEVSVWPIIEDSQFLFCSDGLTDLVRSVQITKILASELPVKEKVESLISSANEAGGKDNITVVLADIKDNEPGEVVSNSEVADKEEILDIDKSKHSRRNFIVGIFLGLIVGAGIMCIYQLINDNSNELKIFTQTDMLQREHQENVELRHKIAVLEDSITKLLEQSKIIPIDSTDNIITDI